MSIAGALYRLSPPPPRATSPRSADPGGSDPIWTLVWCELLDTGEFLVYNDPQESDATRRHLEVTLPVAKCTIARTHCGDRDCMEVKSDDAAKGAPFKETFASHESSFDLDWWVNTLVDVKRDLNRGLKPQLSIICPPATKEQMHTPLPPPPLRPPSLASIGEHGDNPQPGMRRRQPSLKARITCFERYTIYETAATFYVVCSDRHYTRFRMLTLDRTIERPTKLAQVLTEDQEVYSWREMEAQLQTLAERARATGAKLVRAFTAVAIVGCIRFLRGFYFIFVTQRRKIGCIGGNFIYGISATQQLNVSHSNEESSAWSWLNRWFNPSPEEEAEARYLGLFHFIDLTKDFYFSYSYDITHSLQYNMTTETAGPAEMFTWNEFLTREFKSTISPSAGEDLIIPLVLGSYEQRKCSVFGRLVSITLLARRSRHFAGTRYLKRGVADTGKTANDVETEQIIEDENMGVGKFSSFVQYRGSIPVFWSQETSATLPKPPIVLNRVDPTYSASRKHFADLFARYGSPVVALNLVKQSEKKEREVIVGNEFMNAVEYLNSFIPAEHRIRYVALDYSRLSKQKGLNVLQSLDKVAVWALTQTGFFCSAPKRQIGRSDSKQSAYVSLAPSTRQLSPIQRYPSSSNIAGISQSDEEDDDNWEIYIPPSPTIARKSGDWLEQKGVLRTNCIDCLDRTNVSQFSVGMRALGQQLYAMGIRNTPLLESRSQLVRVLMLLYSLAGDAISMQYGGSEAHKNVKNGAGRENLKHRELLTSIRRYYSNSFTDNAKQDAINIFLGHFVPVEGEPALWELESDYYLHNFEVRNGTAACDIVRETLELQAESKRRAVTSIVSPVAVTVVPADAGVEDDEALDVLDQGDALFGSSLRDKQRREAYVQECKRLLADWWKGPLDTFEQRPRMSFARGHGVRQPITDKENGNDVVGSLNGPLATSEEETTARRPKSLSVSSDTFFQMYHPEELTSFDKTLGYKFMNPMELSNESNVPPTKPRVRTSSSTSIEASPRAARLSNTSRIDEDSIFDDTSSSRLGISHPFISSRGIRSMSAPDISDDMLPRQNMAGGAPRYAYGDSDDREHAVPPTLGQTSKGAITFGRSFQYPAHPLHKQAMTRMNDQISIDEFVQRRGIKKFVGECAPVVPDSVYDRYVHWNRSFTLWESDNESVKIYFESYLRDNNIHTDDARSIRDAQFRAGATYKIQSGPYAGLDQNVKARMLVAKKLKTDSEDRKVFEDCMDPKRLMASTKACIPNESLELYKSFFDEELPSVPMMVSVETGAGPMTDSSVNATLQMVTKLQNTILERRKKGGTSRGRAGMDSDLISVGPLFKLDGGKDRDFILFNEAAAENAFADVIKNETELSFYTK